MFTVSRSALPGGRNLESGSTIQLQKKKLLFSVHLFYDTPSPKAPKCVGSTHCKVVEETSRRNRQSDIHRGNFTANRLDIVFSSYWLNLKLLILILGILLVLFDRCSFVNFSVFIIVGTDTESLSTRRANVIFFPSVKSTMNLMRS